MNRFFPLLLCAVAIGGCARSDLGSKAASEVVKQSVKKEARDAKENIKRIGSATLKAGSLIGSDPATGAPLWQLDAKTIETQDQLSDGLPRRATLTGATVKLYQAGKLESTFVAPLIKFSNGDSGLRLLMPNGVRASNAGTLGQGGVPIMVSAPRGDVDIQKRLAVLSGGARVMRGPITATGQTLRTQTDLARSQMDGNVVATSPQGITKAKSAIFAWKQNKLSAQNVTFVRPDLTLTGDKLSADTAAEKGVLSGNVRARTPDSSASAPIANFDWKADSITAPNATVTRAGGTLRAGAIATDSKLKVASAQNVTVNQNGATLRASSANGFDGLANLSGRDVKIVRAGTTLFAPRAKATNWSKDGGVFEGEGGVRATNARGTVTADSATWSGGEKGTIVAQGGVVIRAQNTVLRGARGRSDTAFQNATLSGDVRANLQNGSTLNAPLVEKRGQNVVASGGATALLETPTAGTLTLRAARIETTTGGQSATARGNVSLRSAEGATATAPLATYNRATEKVTASGGVTYNDPKRGIVNNRGDSLDADLSLGSAVIRNARGQTSGQVDLFKGKSLFG